MGDLERDSDWLRIPLGGRVCWSLEWGRDGRHVVLGFADGGLETWDLELVRKQLEELGIATPSTIATVPDFVAAATSSVGPSSRS